ncbi:MAG: N-acetylmuramoyl-L-alanine amidase [Candidatus Omnitrophica bacterium]|nr:N-acetylmuramoyl-L-alanine amidase [Candidatus Omnitrophota bacterium]
MTLICEQRNFPWQWDSLSHVLTFSNKEVSIKVMAGSRLVLAGDRRIILSYPVERKSNTIVVPPDFIRKVFGPEEAQKSAQGEFPLLTSGRFKTVMIDAGHGGHDSGAFGQKGAVEKDIVLDVAQKLKANLEKTGFNVLMTRQTDEFISLQKRTELASQKNVDLFLSIHANSVKSRNRKIKGLEIYYARKLEPDTDITQRKNNESQLFRNFEIEGDRSVPERILSDMMYTNKMQDSSVLAEKIIQKAAKDISTLNRGNRSCGFYVVKNTLVPAILFEIGYLTNENEAKLLKTPEYRQKIADTIAQSLKEYNDES